MISIHAPREGGDLTIPALWPNDPNFNPRPPRGGRLRAYRFMSNKAYISIHAPREGGDLKNQIEFIVFNDFNPRPPRGGRR